MGTAVLHAQDYLAAPQSDPNRHFVCVPEYPSSAARPGVRAFPATYEASIPATEHRKDVVLCKAISNRGRRNSSAGLLPIPDKASQGAHYTYPRLASKPSAFRLGDTLDSYGSKLFTTALRSDFSSYASEMCISRSPSVPMLDHAAHAKRFASAECSPLHGAQLQERKRLQHGARFSLNSAQANGMTGSLYCGGGTAMSCQKLNLLANSQFSGAFNSVHLKRVDSFDQSMQYRKRMHPEVSRVEVGGGRQCAKPSFKVLPCGQDNSIHPNMGIISRKLNANKQLGRSISAKVRESPEMPRLQRPASKEDGSKFITSLSEEVVVGSRTGICGSSKVQVSSDADSRGRMHVLKAGVRRSFSQQMEGTVRNLGASLRLQCAGNINPALEPKDANGVECKDVNSYRMAGSPGCVPQNVDDLCKLYVAKISDNKSAEINVTEPETVNGSEIVLRSCDALLENDEMWASMINDEKWAGPSFVNSPSPSSLPVPSFSFLFARTPASGFKSATTADSGGAGMVSENSSPEAIGTWDITFATKDLRRMLHLDHASCDV